MAHLVQPPARDPQVRYCEQRGNLSSVYLQASVLHLRVSQLALENSKRVVNLGADARLVAFDLGEQGIAGCAGAARSRVGTGHRRLREYGPVAAACVRQ